MMKYLLPFLETLNDGPDLQDPHFQQLLVDVQAGKTQTKSADAFYESLEKIVNELKSTPESFPFQRPVAKRDAPDYYDVIKKPMDLQSVLRNIKAHKYKNKADFAADIDLIWENCFTYNTHESHPIRAQARFMKQKADHHLEFLADKPERGAAQAFSLPLPAESSTATRQAAATSAQAVPQANSLRAAAQVPVGEEDAAGESDDGGAAADGAGDGSFQHEAGAGPQSKTAANGNEATRQGTPVAGRGRSASQADREGSIVSTSIDRGVGGSKPNGLSRSTPPFRPKLQTSLEGAPALIRTPYSMNTFLPISLTQAGPSTLDKGKAKALVCATPPPPWYPGSITSEDEEVKLEGGWWGVMSKDEAYSSGLPSAPTMLSPTALPRKQIVRQRRSSASNYHTNGEGSTPPLESPKPVKLESVIYRSVDKLNEARKVMGQINDWQRAEAEGGVLPYPFLGEAEEKERVKDERREMKRARKVETDEGNKRRKLGGEAGEKEAVHILKKASAGLLAHAGFEGANEIALDMFTRVAIDHMRNMGRTFRLFLDGFSQKMSSEELVLHALHENGQLQTQDLEAHIKDDIEREGGKISEMTRKVRQAYKEVTTAPVIEDDMMFNENNEMLTDGNFAEELGEDFLGLRELGIDKEFGLRTLSVPSSLFHGRRKRTALADLAGPGTRPDYQPPPPFIPLQPATYQSQLPALLHPFFASLLESGRGLADDEGFDQSHSLIGSLGQIVVKNAPTGGAGAKKKRDEEARKEEKKEKPKKAVQPGVGKGNWIRPSKEEREKKAAEKRAALAEKQRLNGGEPVSGSEDAEGEEE